MGYLPSREFCFLYVDSGRGSLKISIHGSELSISSPMQCSVTRQFNSLKSLPILTAGTFSRENIESYHLRKSCFLHLGLYQMVFVLSIQIFVYKEVSQFSYINLRTNFKLNAKRPDSINRGGEFARLPGPKEEQRNYLTAFLTIESIEINFHFDSEMSFRRSHKYLSNEMPHWLFRSIYPIFKLT